MTIKIEEGKFYRTRDGRKVGPMRCDDYGDAECDHMDSDLDRQVWLPNGKVWEENGDESDHYLIAEWEDTPKLWKDMSDEEKGSLLLAQHNGEAIECLDTHYNMWFPCGDIPLWLKNMAYHVKPKPEPKVETTCAYWCVYGASTYKADGWHTHKITFDVIDGKPDCNSVKMEEL